jgi:hypothetical protein
MRDEGAARHPTDRAHPRRRHDPGDEVELPRHGDARGEEARGPEHGPADQHDTSGPEAIHEGANHRGEEALDDGGEREGAGGQPPAPAELLDERDEEDGEGEEEPEGCGIGSPTSESVRLCHGDETPGRATGAGAW